jgi:transcriptional regulator with XRE-family HTH domain
MPVRGEFTTVNTAGRKRAVARRTLRLAAPGVTRRGREVVEILNLSVTGMLIQSTAKLAIGEKLEVELPHSGPVTATVAWAGDNLFGCRFAQRLPQAAVSAALLKSEPAPAPVRGPASSLPARLRQLREGRGLTLDQLAQALGVSRQTAWYWERGRNLPGPANLHRLAEVLGVAERDLLSDRAEPAQSAQNLAALVAAKKAEIARFAGTAEEQVRIVIEL